jgi:hypothetical protein
MSSKSQCRIYRRFQIWSLTKNPIILFKDIQLFLAKLLQDRHFQENRKIQKFKVSSVKSLSFAEKRELVTLFLVYASSVLALI